MAISKVETERYVKITARPVVARGFTSLPGGQGATRAPKSVAHYPVAVRIPVVFHP